MRSSLCCLCSFRDHCKGVGVSRVRLNAAISRPGGYHGQAQGVRLLAFGLVYPQSAEAEEHSDKNGCFHHGACPSNFQKNKLEPETHEPAICGTRKEDPIWKVPRYLERTRARKHWRTVDSKFQIGKAPSLEGSVER